jgi:hypothetical protein
MDGCGRRPSVLGLLTGSLPRIVCVLPLFMAAPKEKANEYKQVLAGLGKLCGERTACEMVQGEYYHEDAKGLWDGERGA